jgi:cell division protein FtsB
MKDKLVMAALLFLFAACPAEAYAQDAASAQQSVENLRSQLQDIDAKQSALEARMRQLDEDMRPENIERSLALTGSTRPEELRAQRRQQLEKEKAALQSQLDQLATSRTRLQSAIAAAETATYQQAGGTNTTAAPQQTSTVNNQTPTTPTTRSVQPQPRTNRKRARRSRTRRRTQ